MTQTKSPAHTPDCRKVADPSHCLCHVGAYTDQHPFICTNHTLAWHHKDRSTCEEFEQSLDTSVGFSAELDDAAALEARKFRISRDAEVLALTGKLSRAERQTNLWQKVATVQTGLYTLAVIAFSGHSLGWW